VRAPDFSAQITGGREPGGLIQPARKNDSGAQSTSFFRQDDEDRLRDFLGGVGIAGLPQRGGIDQVDVTRDEGGEGVLGIPMDVIAQQFHVSRILHPLTNGRRNGKVPIYFGGAEFPVALE
jgi:hypothetical protein